MRRNSTRVAWALSLGFLLAACSAAAPAPDSKPGSLALALDLPSGAVLAHVGYSISAGALQQPRSGTIDVTLPGATITAAIGGIPAATGYLLTLTGSLSDASACLGSATFDIAAGQTTAVLTTMSCKPAAHTGTAIVNGVTVNVCPTIDALATAPLSAAEGSQINVSATVSDIDGDLPTFAWTATAGALANPAAANATYTCVLGTQTLTLTIDDGHGCQTSGTVSVVCTPLICPTCDPHAACRNIAGQAVCVCGSGFQGDGSTCTDLDECAMNTSNCAALATCTNTVGSFSCTCNAGYFGSGVTCADIDECAAHASNCAAQAICTNTVGSFTCACGPGYQGDGLTCTDVDECAMHTSNCSALATCTNTVGSFSCACIAGFQGNGVTCTDIDECVAHTSNCSALATCTNTPGSFTCACNPGYQGNGVTCVDIDECRTGVASCGLGTCYNTPGAFGCTCPANYYFDGLTCADINECVTGANNCGTTNVCENSVGSYYCLPRALFRASVSTSNGDPNGLSQRPALSQNGRYVAYESIASNLVAGDSNGKLDVFVLDRFTGVTTRASVSSGGGQGDGDSSAPAISWDGRYVAFHSFATNLVSGDTNGAWDVFVHDMTTGATRRASISSSAAQATGGDSTLPAISADGRLLVFKSTAANLVTGDVNNQEDVFVHDMISGATSLVSVSTSGLQADAPCGEQVISADGHVVAFSTYASTMVVGDNNGLSDVFVHDLSSGATTRVSVSSAGVQGNQASLLPELSQDGRYVAFTSNATNLVAFDLAGYRDVFVNDRSTGLTLRESVGNGGAEANSASTLESISADGRYVAFSSTASNLSPGDVNGVEDIFVRDRTAASTVLVSMSAAGVRTNNTSTQPVISADGHFVGFRSSATNLVSGDNNGALDIFVVANPLEP